MSTLAEHAKKINDAFMLWCKSNKIIHDNLYDDIKRSPTEGQPLINFKIELRHLFPKKISGPFHKYIHKYPSKIESFIRYISEITQSNNHKLITQKSTIDGYELDYPQMNFKGEFKFEGDDGNEPVCFLYFYSDKKQIRSENKKLIYSPSSEYNFETAEIYIAEEHQHKKSGPAKIIINTHPRKIELYAQWYIERNIVHYMAIEATLKNTKYRNKVVSRYTINFYLNKHKTGETNFYVGVYSSMQMIETAETYTPACGLVIAVWKGVAQKNDELKSLLHYILRHKLYKADHGGFTFPITDDALTEIPSQAQIWYEDIKEIKGNYAVYFFDPISKKFNKGFMNIDIDGTVILYTRTNAQCNDPYTGVIKKINGESENRKLRKQNNLIISLSYFPNEYEYRVRIFLTKNIKHDRYILSGVYSALQYEGHMPFSALFAAVQLDDAKVLENKSQQSNDLDNFSILKQKIQKDEDVEFESFENLIEDDDDLKKLISKIKNSDVRKIFTSKMTLLNTISLKSPF